MRHKLQGKKLNRTSSHRKALFANMATSLVIHEQIKTTVPKAKALRPVIEKLVTKAKKGNLAACREINGALQDKVAAKKLLSVLASRYQNRPGGYTRIIKAGFRRGDNAPVAYIEFVDKDITAKGKGVVNQLLTEITETETSANKVE